MASTVQRVHKGCKEIPVYLVSRGIQAQQECLVPPQTQGRRDHLEALDSLEALVQPAPLPHSPDRLDHKVRRELRGQMAKMAVLGDRVQLECKALEALMEPTAPTDNQVCRA